MHTYIYHISRVIIAVCVSVLVCLYIFMHLYTHSSIIAYIYIAGEGLKRPQHRDHP
jgi:hypothetical protein